MQLSTDNSTTTTIAPATPFTALLDDADAYAVDAHMALVGWDGGMSSNLAASSIELAIETLARADHVAAPAAARDAARHGQSLLVSALDVVECSVDVAPTAALPLIASAFDSLAHARDLLATR